ncbi:helix-turn-helix domain-containing protein [Clostridium sediminicola]|uniref:MerR family transcriptional regulator n=1 Tax=Clostridium sediminicola TaxID=3114879 RepID=UPI0031F1D76B
MERLTIGQMSKLNNISKQALRLYDKIGLLKPYIINEETGYRYYSIKQSAQLDMIQYMKSLGMTLSDIKNIFDKNDLFVMKSILQQKSEEINKQIKKLKYQKRAIERSIGSYERYENSPSDGTILVEYIEKRRMYCVDEGLNFYDYDIDVYEGMLRELKNKLISDGVPEIYFCNAGTILRKENLEKQKFVSSEVFVFVDKEHVDEKLIVQIPSNTYLCIYCSSFDKEKEYILKLLNEVEKKRYEIVGDYICEVLAELPVFHNEERSMFSRLQIPIKIR